MRHANSPLSFSPVERAELAKAWLMTSLAFAIFFLRTGFVDAEGLSFAGFALVFGIAALTAGLGFVLHELCHKVAAHRFRVQAEFRSNGMMLVVSVFLALVGFLFAAPGAVYMSGSVTRRENGIISAAGPASNMILALLFLPLALLSDRSSIAGTIGAFGTLINAILGAFNLIPFLGLDGAKILAWSKGVYFSLLVAAGAIVAAAYALV